VTCLLIEKLLNLKEKSIFITGTDTGIGKTYTSAYVLKEISKFVAKTIYFKPIETGINQGKPENSDPRIIERYSKETIIKSSYSFKLPATPYLAASLENQQISLGKIQADFSKLRKDEPGIIVVEGAGGLLVPLTKKYTIVDLIKLIKIPTLLISQNYLGTINHTLLSLFALKEKNINVVGFVFAYRGKKDDLKISAEVKRKNARIIEKFSKVPFLGEIKKISQLF